MDRAISTGLSQTSRLMWALTWGALLATAIMGVIRIRSLPPDVRVTPTAAPWLGGLHDPAPEDRRLWPGSGTPGRRIHADRR